MPSVGSGRGRGFLRLERSGERVTDSNVEPFETLVTVVLIEATLPAVPAPLRMPLYGLPEASVTETPLRLRGSLKPGLLNVVALAGDEASSAIVGSPPELREKMTSYTAATNSAIDKTITTICKSKRNHNQVRRTPFYGGSLTCM